MTPYERVQLSRQRTAATFPLPSVLDCIRYAITELAEYDDALLRAERTGDKRNNDKAHDARGELGQALYMLLSAYAQWDAQPDLHIYQKERHEQWLDSVMYFSAMQDLAHLASDAYCVVGKDVPRYELPVLDDLLGVADEAYTDMCELALLRGWPVDALIDDTCNRFEAKHAPQEQPR
jgi:hypothetical protein